MKLKKYKILHNPFIIIKREKMNNKSCSVKKKLKLFRIILCMENSTSIVPT